MNAPIYDIFFTGSTDPRRCIMIGGIGGIESAVYLEFRTLTVPSVETTTTILRNGNIPVATFQWTMDTHLGTATIGERRLPMIDLVQPGIDPSCRVFQAADGQLFHWRKRTDEANAYDLYSLGPNQLQISVVAQFRTSGMTSSPIGPCHAHMQSWLTDNMHLLYASLALCLNRWIEWQGF